MRLGVAFQLMAALSGIVLLTIAATTISYISSRELGEAFARVAEEYLPVLAEAAELAQQGQTLAANAPSLVVADNQFARRTVTFRIKDQSQALDSLSAGLARRGLSDTMVADLDIKRSDLVRNLKTLDATQEAKINLIQEGLDLHRELLDLRKIVQELTPPPEDALDILKADDSGAIKPRYHWALFTHQAMQTLFAALSDRRSDTLERLAREFREQLAFAEATLRLLSPDIRPQATQVTRRLRHIGVSTVDSPFAVQYEQGQLLYQIQSALSGNRVFSDRFVTAVGTVVDGIAEDALATSRASVERIQQVNLILFIIAVICLLGAIGILFLVKTGALKRLNALRQSMVAHVEGRAVAIPDSGNDEIADMGMALAYFVATIQAREQSLNDQNEALRTAREEAEQTLAELREAQDALIQSEKMASLGQLVAGVSHELNTPVGSSLTAATTLERRTRQLVDGLESGQIRKSDLTSYTGIASECARLITFNLNHAAQLIQSFKDLSVDVEQTDRRRFQLDDLLREVELALSPRTRKLGHAVTVDIAAPIECDSYPGAITQVVMNLVVNAMVHAFDPDQHGSVTVRLQRPADDRVALTVEDNGKGMSEAVQRRAFDPFYTTARGKGGTGLGLHIVYSLVTQVLGGTIRIESRATGGTAMMLSLPVIAPVSPVRAPDQAELQEARS